MTQKDLSVRIDTNSFKLHMLLCLDLGDFDLVNCRDLVDYVFLLLDWWQKWSDWHHLVDIFAFEKSKESNTNEKMLQVPTKKMLEVPAKMVSSQENH